MPTRLKTVAGGHGRSAVARKVINGGANAIMSPLGYWGGNKRVV